MKWNSVRGWRIVLLGLLLAFWSVSSYGQWLGSSPTTSGVMRAMDIPKSDLLSPEELNRQLQTHSHESPLMLQVGSRMLYDQAHIPGSEYVAPTYQTAGLEMLRNRVDKLPRNRSIVVYCGCCPWDRCPNVGSAWRLLHDMGFTHAKVLYIVDNFGADWVAKGYRVEKSQ